MLGWLNPRGSAPEVRAFTFPPLQLPRCAAILKASSPQSRCPSLASTLASSDPLFRGDWLRAASVDSQGG